MGIGPSEPKHHFTREAYFFERLRIVCTKPFTAELVALWVVGLEQEESKRVVLSSDQWLES